MLLIFVDQLNMGVKRVDPFGFGGEFRSPRGLPLRSSIPSVRMNSESDAPRTSMRDWVRTASVEIQARIRRGQVAEGEFVATASGHIERIRAVGALIPNPVAGVGAGQAAQRHHPRHETEIGVRFAGRNKQVHLIGLGEVVPRLGRGFADRWHRRVIQAGDDLADWNQPAAVADSWFSFSHVPQTRQGH